MSALDGMLRAAWLMLAGVLCASCASGPVTIYDGAWSGFCGSSTDLVIHGPSGRAAPHVDAVVGKEVACSAPVPVLVQSATTTQIVMTIKSSDAGAGCADSTLTLKPVDSTHLEGTRVVDATRAACRLTRR